MEKPKAAKADLSLLRPVTQEGYDAEPFNAPYIADFRRGSKRLTFIATFHETGPETPSAKTIEQAFHDAEPRMLVVESFDARPATGKKFRARILRQAANGCADCKESEYVVYGSGHLVKQRKIWEKLFGTSENSKPF